MRGADCRDSGRSLAARGPRACDGDNARSSRRHRHALISAKRRVLPKESQVGAEEWRRGGGTKGGGGRFVQSEQL